MNIFISICGVIFLVFLVLLFRYRFLTSNSVIIIDSSIKYKMIDIEQKDYVRYSFESINRNKRIWLAEPYDAIKWVYVSKVDFDKLWPESPLEMSDKNYYIKAKFELKKMLFGDYSLAKVIAFEKVIGKPCIEK